MVGLLYGKNNFPKDEKDCDVACMAMILKHYKTEIPIHKLRELSETDLEGTSAFGLKHVFEQIGFESPALKAEKDVWKEKELPLPLIAHIMVEKNICIMWLCTRYKMRNC
ncbi:hypothetical protein IGI96_003848 [Enterococcus sp. DIV0421]